jgi:hypothetical protein
VNGACDWPETRIPHSGQNTSAVPKLVPHLLHRTQHHSPDQPT